MFLFVCLSLVDSRPHFSKHFPIVCISFSEAVPLNMQSSVCIFFVKLLLNAMCARNGNVVVKRKRCKKKRKKKKKGNKHFASQLQIKTLWLSHKFGWPPFNFSYLSWIAFLEVVPTRTHTWYEKGLCKHFPVSMTFSLQIWRAEPILQRIKEDRTRVISPSFDNIKYDTFEIEEYPLSAQGFDWELWCRYLNPPKSWWYKGNKSAPIQ